MARSAGLALAVYGARSDRARRRYEAGIESAQAAGSDRVLISIFLLGRHGLAVPCSRRSATRATARCAPGSGCDADSALTFAEDSRLRGTRTLPPSATCTHAGKLTVIPAIGYDDANQSHFTSRHYWEVGELNPAGRIGWLGRFLDMHGSTTTRCRGCRWTGTLAPSLASGRCAGRRRRPSPTVQPVRP